MGSEATELEARMAGVEGRRMPGRPSNAEIASLLRFAVALSVIFAVVGIVYALGIAGSNKTLGVALFAAAIGCLWSCWIVWRRLKGLDSRGVGRGDD